MTEPDRLAEARAIARAAASGEMPPDIALMRLILLADSEEDLSGLISVATGDAGEIAPLRSLADLASRHPDAWAIVRAAAAAIPHTANDGQTVEAQLGVLAASFDRAAAISPEASVALYSLGDADRLAAAAGEIVDWMRGLGLLGPARRVLDIGCGIGRLETALHAEVAQIVGIDISAEMVRIARQRCAALPGVEIRLTSGLDLDGVEDAAFDCVIAVDIFPYLVGSGGELAGRHISESARALSAGGDLVILNYSYRHSPALDCEDVERHAAAAGLEIVSLGGRPFRRWDAAAFHLAKPN